MEPILQGQSFSKAAKIVGINSSNFTRWKKGARADPDFVVKIARAYNRNVLEALVAADFITEEEAGLKERDSSVSDLRTATGEQLANEVLRRMRLTPRYDPPYEPPEGIEVFPRVVQDESEPEEFDPERMAAWHGETDLPPDDQFNA